MTGSSGNGAATNARDGFVLVVNPHAGAGRVGTVLPAIESALRARGAAFRTERTAGPGDAARIVRAALRGGAPGVAVVGGDGTLSEATSGFFTETGEPLAPGAFLAPISAGTGGDFRKSVGAHNLDRRGAKVADVVDRMLNATPRPIDAGWLEHLDHDGKPARRAFINIASLGMGGLVDRLVDDPPVWAPKWMGGRAAFFAGSVRALVRYRPMAVRIRLDGGPPRETTILNVMVANGQYFGGGMHAAPRAVIDDGLFDVVGMEMTKAEAMLATKRLYDGTLLSHPRVTFARAETVTVEPVSDADAVLLDVDGEAPGKLPATFAMRARAFHLRA